MVKHNLFNVFYYLDLFLHCSFQRHVSAVVMSHLQVDHIFLSKVNHTISNAIVIVSNNNAIFIFKNN